jgi:hypothetical protein
LALALVAAACTSVDAPTVQQDTVALPTPLRSLDVSADTTVAALAAALGTIGERLVEPPGPYRPSEPPSLMQVPRVIRRAELADVGDGFVVIYEAPSRADAERLAGDLADYLGSGFGMTNYVADTQFAVSVLDETIIFTSWSARSSDDPERAQAAFEAMAAVGEPVVVER